MLSLCIFIFISVQKLTLYILSQLSECMSILKRKSNLNWVSKHPKWVLLIWLIFISLTIAVNAPVLLNSAISNQRTFTESKSESGIGSTIIKESFHLNSSGTTDTLVITGNSANFTAPQYTNWLLYYTMYLNSSFNNNSLKYDSIISYPILKLAGAGEFALSLVSKDRHTTLISISSKNRTVNDISNHEIELMRQIIKNSSAFTNYINDKAKLTSSKVITLDQVKRINFYLTGDKPNFYDISHNSEQAFRQSEIISLIVVVIILALVFRSPMGVAIPLVALLGSLFGAYLGTYLLSNAGLVQVSDFLPSIIAMIGIAIAVDYNLFSIVRYREEYRRRKAEHTHNGTWNSFTRKETEQISATIMARTSGHAVTFSGITVIIGFAALALVNSSLTQSMAIGVSIVVVLSILSANSLTPALLSLWGRFLDWPAVATGHNKDVKEIENSRRTGIQKRTFWGSWAKGVMKLPVTYLVLALLIFAPFVSLSFQTDLSFDSIQNLPKNSESRLGTELILQKFDLGSLTPIRVVIQTSSQNGVFNADIFNKTTELAQWAMQFNQKRKFQNVYLNFSTVNAINVFTVPNSRNLQEFSLATVQNILKSPDYVPKQLPNGSFIQIPNIQKLSYLKNTQNLVNFKYGANVSIIDFTTNLDFGSGGAWELVGYLRTEAHKLFDNLSGVKGVYVTGASASLLDSKNSLYNDVPKMLSFAVIAIFFALMILFRSVILPIKAIVTIAGSILFGLGTLVFVFQDGNFVSLIGAEKSGVSFFIPIFLFTTILGLGMDYSIFIISRIKEEVDKERKEGKLSQHEMDIKSVSVGISKTAGVITSAATIMIATFAVFALSPILILKTMGLAMAVAILVDATISRVIILPAAMRLAGKWNWWLPKWLKKVIPEIKLEH